VVISNQVLPQVDGSAMFAGPQLTPIGVFYWVTWHLPNTDSIQFLASCLTSCILCLFRRYLCKGRAEERICKVLSSPWVKLKQRFNMLCDSLFWYLHILAPTRTPHHRRNQARLRTSTHRSTISFCMWRRSSNAALWWWRAPISTLTMAKTWAAGTNLRPGGLYGETWLEFAIILLFGVYFSF
jgi:hypothetical protein